MSQSIKDRTAKGKIGRQDEFLNITLNSLTHLFLVIDANNYTIRKFNQIASSGDLPPGTTCYQLTHGSGTPCQGDNHICPIGEIKKTKKPVVVEHIHSDKDGNSRNIEVRGFPILNDTGDVVEIVEYFLDITERKQTEEELNEANSIINRSSSVAFTWKNMEGWPVEFVTKNVEKLFGYTVEEFKSGAISYSECIHPDDLQRVANEVETFSEEDRRTEFVHEPYRIVTKDGSVRVINDWTFIVRNDQGQITHYKGIVEDITERKLVEDELKEKNRLPNIILDGLPFPAMLVRKNRVVIAANKVARNVGAKVGGFCWRDFGQSEYISEKDKDYINKHKCVPESVTHCTFCLADKTFETNEFQNSPEIQMFGRTWDTYWIPVDDEIYLHFAIDVTERKQMEQKLRKRTHDLGERVKELGCLFGISKLMQNPNCSYKEVLQGVIEIIPPSLQYP